MLKCHEFTVTVRKAKRDDMVQVYKMIKALAEYERLEHQVIINEKVLQKDGFDSEHPAFTCIVAELSDGHIVGYALFYYSYSTWEGKSLFLEDLYVQPAYRCNGIGKQLFMAVAKIAYDVKIRRLDFHVLSWNPAVDFYKRLGAINLTQTEKWTLFRMDHDCINKLFLA